MPGPIAIHQLLFDGVLPPLNAACVESWRALPQDTFPLESWTNDRLRAFVATAPPLVRDLMARAANFGEASDTLRIVILHAYGGIYTDWDIYLAAPARFAAILRAHPPDQALLLDDPRTRDRDFASIITHSWIYAPAGHPLLWAFLEQMQANYAAGVQGTLDLNGPQAFTRFLREQPHYLAHARVLDQVTMYRYDFHEVAAVTDRQRLLAAPNPRPEAPLINLWTNEWIRRPSWIQRLRGRSPFEQSKAAILGPGR